MSEKRHVVKVRIVGEEYTIRSDATPEHTRAVARYLDESIRRVLAAGALVETSRARCWPPCRSPTSSFVSGRPRSPSMTRSGP